MMGLDLFGFPLPNQELPTRQTKIAMGLAVAVHLALLLAGILSPYLLNRRPLLSEIYTVNLIAVTDSPPMVAAKPKPAPQPAPVAPPPAKVKPTPAPVAAKAPPKPTAKPAVSLRPIKRKTTQDVKAVDSIRQQMHARQEAEKAQQQADKAVSSALTAIRQSLSAPPHPTVAESTATAGDTAPTTAGGPMGSAVVDEARRRYFAAVYERIKEHFLLPDLKNWQADLQAVLVIRVRRDGIVTHSSFEQKSANIFFNQAVEKALAEAAPMPPFPAELKENGLEFGLRFRPGDLL